MMLTSSNQVEAVPPLVSVVVPTYNSARYIPEAVDSVLNQTYARHEVIVVDDGSTDDTRRILQSYSGQIHYVYQDNQGPAAARNNGLRLARGEFVVFLDADDFLLPGKLAGQVACFEAHPGLGLVHSGWRLVNRQGEKIADVRPWRDAPRLDLKTWLLWKPVFMGAMMFRRDELARSGGFDTRFRQAEDVDLVLRLALRGCRTAWVYASTVCYRQHGGGITQNGLQQARDLIAVLDKFFAQPSVPRRIRRWENKIRYYTLIWLAWYLHHTGYTDHVALHLRQSLRYTPYTPAQTVFDWVTQLTKLSSRDDPEVSEFRAMVPQLRAAVQFDDDLCVTIERTVDCWMDVWRHEVSRDHGRAARGLVSYRGWTTRQLVKLAQSRLLVSPFSDIVEIVDQFWRDVRATRLTTESSHHEMTALCLTACRRAFLAGYWRIAMQALWRAAGVGFHPQAVAAWVRFLRAGLLCVSGRVESALDGVLLHETTE